MNTFPYWTQPDAANFLDALIAAQNVGRAVEHAAPRVWEHQDFLESLYDQMQMRVEGAFQRDLALMQAENNHVECPQ